MHKPEAVLESGMHEFLWDFEVQIDHWILAKRPDLVLINKKKRTCHIKDFVVPVNYEVKVKEDKELDKYKCHFIRELKKLWNMEMIVIQIIIGVLGMVSKNLEKRFDELEIRGRIKIIKNYYYYYYYYYYLCKFFTLVLTGGFSLEFEWQ